MIIFSFNLISEEYAVISPAEYILPDISSCHLLADADQPPIRNTLSESNPKLTAYCPPLCQEKNAELLDVEYACNGGPDKLPDVGPKLL